MCVCVCVRACVYTVVRKLREQEPQPSRGSGRRVDTGWRAGGLLDVMYTSEAGVAGSSSSTASTGPHVLPRNSLMSVTGICTRIGLVGLIASSVVVSRPPMRCPTGICPLRNLHALV